jgi:hypothetical protein
VLLLLSFEYPFEFMMLASVLLIVRRRSRRNMEDAIGMLQKELIWLTYDV